MNVEQWWSSIPSHKLPQWGTSLVSFMTPVVALFADFLPAGVSCGWSEDVDSAYADRENNKLVISSKILSANPERRPNNKATKLEAIAAVLGAQLHETGHFLYSPNSIPDLMPVGVEPDAIRSSIVNIVEDIYIENKLMSFKPDLAWMLQDGLWPYFFPADEAEKFRKVWPGIKPETVKQANAAVGFISQAWRSFDEIASSGEYEDGLRRLFMSVVGMDGLDDRRNLNNEIFRYLGLEELTAKQPEQEQGEGDGEGQEQENEKGKGGGEGQDDEGEGKRLRTADGKVVNPGAVRIDEKIEPSWDDSKMLDLDSAGEIPVEIHRAASGLSSQPIPVNRTWDKLAELQKDAATARRVPGPAGHVGRLTNPERMFSDGRMFSNSVMENADGGSFSYRPLEIILFIDRSGSMCRDNKFDNASIMAANMARTLSNAGVNLLVATHQTDYDSVFGEKCVISIIKGFKESYSSTVSRFQTMRRLGAGGANADADALRSIAKQFSPASSGRRRLVIVISDGQPACDFYGGMAGIERTAAVVNGLRKQGIEIYSVSIDSVAVAPNDKIYGPKYNVNSSDPNVAAQLLKKLIRD